MAVAGFVGQFHAFAGCSKHNSVITNDIAASNRVHAYLAPGAGADNALTAVAHVVLVLQAGYFAEDFTEAFRGATGGIDLQMVVHFHDFEVKIGSEDFGGAPGEPE